MLKPAGSIALAASGGFLLVGLLCGVWKYRQMMASPKHEAHPYVDIAHRAALLYSFAALVMMKLVEFSPYAPFTQMGAVVVPLFFFATAVATYLWHGAFRAETTQFAKRNFITTWGMLFLIAGEIGGIAILFWGFVQSQWLTPL